VTRADACTIITIKVFVEQQQISPVRIYLKLNCCY